MNHHSTDANSHPGDESDLIVVEDMTIGYGDKTILENVSLTIRKGEIFCIIGPSGCGKSTLLNAIIGLVPVRSGRIFVAGEMIAPMEDKDALRRARQHMGVLFQSGALLDWMSIGENIAFPLRELRMPEDLIQQMVRIKLELVKMNNQADLMPSELSGGMVRRAGLAVAMAREPPILFCDEPSAGLDPVTAKQIDELLIEFNNYFELTIVVVTHQVPSLENIATRCVMLDKEKKEIIASGSLEELKDESQDERVRSFFQRHTNMKPKKRAHDEVQ